MKTFIQNRDDKNVCVVVEGPETAGQLAFVMHGLSGNKNELHIRAMAETFLDAGYTVVTFDTTNTFGESEGQYEDATLTGYYNDLEDVITWASKQAWYAEPFVLVGHSLGGISAALFAQKYPNKVRALAPVSTVVSGELTLQTPLSDPRSQYLDEWKRAGFQITKGPGGREERLKWACMEDRLRYDLLPEATKLTMPVFMAVGDKDESTPPKHQQILYDTLPSKKELHIIAGAEHSFTRPHEREELATLLKDWVAKL